MSRLWCYASAAVLLNAVPAVSREWYTGADGKILLAPATIAVNRMIVAAVKGVQAREGRR